MRFSMIFMTVGLGLVGCSPSPGSIPVFGGGNTAPVARAAAAEQAPLGEPVLLDGTASYDPDGDELTWQWAVDVRPPGSELPANPFTINDSRNAGRTEVLFDVPGLYVFTLQVVDPEGSRSHTTFAAVMAVADPTLPIADAGADTAGLEGESVCVDGSGSQDPRGRELSYAWSVALRPPGSTLVEGLLDSPDRAETCFLPDLPGEYLLSLIVDADGTSGAPDYVSVYVHSTNRGPEARPHALDGHSCAPVQLDGSESFDPDGDALTYRWDLLLAPFDSIVRSGEDAFLDSTATQPVFYADVPGEYVAQLVVTDGENWSEPELLTLDLTPKLHNLAPEVVHTEDVYLHRTPASCWSTCPAMSLTLDAWGSSDPDGDLLEVAWSIASGDASLHSNVGNEVEIEVASPQANCGTTPRNLVEVDVTATDCSGASSTSRLVIAYDCG
jgi:hypothetical protein